MTWNLENVIDWNNPNLDLDKILGIPDIDSEFDLWINDDIINILDLKLKEDFNDETFWLYNWKNLLWIIEYSNEVEWVHIDFLWTINWKLDSVVADNEFRTKFEWYFWDSNLSVKWIWKDLFLRFIKKFESWTYLTLISIGWSTLFYNKILKEFENKWIISIIEKAPEYKLIIL